jgi:protoporphyrin/coproporphyrin ferrochelatase
MKAEKTAVLIMNTGSPDRPSIPSVWIYLTKFLNDKRVIDLPWLLRKFLVNCIIIPFRVRKSTKLYKRLWTESGSPLIFNSFKLKKKLQEKLGDDLEVFLAMRYQKPGFQKAVTQIKKKKFSKLVLFPLYPHYAMSTTETTIAAVKKELGKQHVEIELHVVEQFYLDPGFIRAFADQGRKYGLSNYDHVVFSYHGLPNRHLEKIHPGIKPEDCSCRDSLPEHGRRCYRATCYATTRLLAKELELKPEEYSVAFQSRLSKNWMDPFTDEVLLTKLQEGRKRILVFAPAFVTDCLETLIEIGQEYREMFLEKGGEELQLVESLNAEDQWIDAMQNLILSALTNQVGQSFPTDGKFLKE